jgi:hypothetical protein
VRCSLGTTASGSRSKNVLRRLVDELQLDQQQHISGSNSKQRSSKRVSSTVKAQREFLEQLRRSSSVGEGLSSGSGCGLYQPGAAAAAPAVFAAVPAPCEGLVPGKAASPLRRVTGVSGLVEQQQGGGASAEPGNVLAMLQQVVQLQQLVQQQQQQQQQSAAGGQTGASGLVCSPVLPTAGGSASRRASRQQQQGLQSTLHPADAEANLQQQQQPGSGRKSHRRQRSGAVMSRVSSNLSQMLALSVSGSSDAEEALELRGSMDAAGNDIMQQLSSDTV